MKISIIIIFLAVFLLSKYSNAQSSDVIKYYIAFDQSGSVGWMDKFKNQEELIKTIIGFQDNKLNSNVQIELISFGQETKINNENIVSHDPYKRITKANREKVVEKINSLIKPNTHQQFTHLHVALQSILHSIEKIDVSTGVFILTDGIINDGDFDTAIAKTRENYIKIIDTLITRIETQLGKPIFIIQSSNIPTNPFLKKKNLIDNISNAPSYLVEKNFFWTNARKQYKSNPAADSAFKDFIQYANNLIVTENTFEKGDQVGAAILFQQAVLNLNLISKSEYNWNEILKNLNKPDDILLIQHLNNLNKYLKDSLFSTQKIYEIIKSLDTLSKNPDFLKRVNDNIRLNLNRKDIVHIKKPIIFADVFANRSITKLDVIAEKSTHKTIEEKVLLGLTDYVIDRTKQEVVLAFIENLDDNVFKKGTQASILRDTLFPNLSTLISESPHISDLAILKESFAKDIKSLPTNIIKYHERLVQTEGLLAFAAIANLHKNILYEGNLETAFNNLANALQPKTKNNKNENILIKESTYKINTALRFTANLIGNLEKYNLVELYKNPDSLIELSKLLIAISLDTTKIKIVKLDCKRRSN